VIEIERVSKNFGRVAALREVSLTIARGERVALVGSNGSGKTTLLRALLGLIRVSGRVTIDAVDVAKRPELALRHVAYVPQIAPPLEAPVREVVAALCSLRGTKPAALAARAEQLGLELAAIERTRFRDLSGGMRQKLLAALALTARADVLVCDEPTANLDAAARAGFFLQLAELEPEAIVILCSHRAEEVHGFVERVVSMRDGRVEHDERKSKPGPVALRAVP
jgi:ABC-type multidrug transport system ATPase subunit